MLTAKRKPASVGEILYEVFMQPMGLKQVALAKVSRTAQTCQRTVQ